MESVRRFCRLAKAVAPSMRNKSFCVDDAMFSLSEDQQRFRSSIRSFAAKELEPFAADIDRQDNFSQFRQFWRKLGDMGLLGLTIPEKYGGSGANYIDHCVAMEEISRVSAAIGLSYGAHSNLCVNQIYRYGTEEQKRLYLPKLCSGEYVGALAMTETSAGSDALGMSTSATPDEAGGYYINGTKFWITNASQADIVVLYVKIGGSELAPKDSLSAVIFETNNTKGFSVGKMIEKMGMRGSPTGELVFDQCKVRADQLLGYKGKAIGTLMSGLDIERGILSAGPVGLMQACNDVAFEYAQERRQFGSSINTYQMVQSLMAEMYVRLLTSRLLVYANARAMDEGRVSSKDCAATILYVSNSAVQTALDAIQIVGANGYSTEYPVERYLRDAKLFQIGAGTTEIRKLIIGRAIANETSQN